MATKTLKANKRQRQYGCQQRVCWCHDASRPETEMVCSYCGCWYHAPAKFKEAKS